MADAHEDEVEDEEVAAEEVVEEEPVDIDDITVSDVCTKYRDAAKIVDLAIQGLTLQAVAGARVLDLCKFGDSVILAKCASIYAKKVSVNECVCHNSPLESDANVDPPLAEGDVVKLDVGCYVDGYIAVAAHTLIVGAAFSPEAPLTGPRADAFVAAHICGEVATKLLRPGNTNSQITAAVAQVTKALGVSAVAGVLCHRMKRFVVDGNKVILLRDDVEHKVETQTFEAGEVYSVDIAMSTGDGKPRPSAQRTTVYKRAVDKNYRLKMRASRYLFNEVNSKFPALPFALRACGDERQARMGVVELLKHELLHEYPVRRPRRSRRLGRAAFGPNAPETRPSKASRRSGPRPRPSDGPSGRRASPARALFSAVRCIGQRRRRRRAPRVRDPPCYRAPRAGRFLPSPLEVALQGICPWQRRSPERPRKCSGDEAGMARSAQPRKLEAIAEAWEQARLCRGIQGPKHICSVGKVPFNGPFSAPARSNGPAEKGPAEKGPAEKASTTPKWTGSQVSARAGTDDLDDPGRWLSLVWGTFGRAALVRSLGPFNGPWGRSTVDRAHPRKTRRCHGQNGPTKNGAPSRGGPLCAVRNKPGVGREAFPKGISKRHFFKKADTGGSFKARFPQDGASNKARSEKVAKWAVVQRPPCL